MLGLIVELIKTKHVKDEVLKKIKDETTQIQKIFYYISRYPL